MKDLNMETINTPAAPDPGTYGFTKSREVTEVWIVTNGNYVHGVFDNEDTANQYLVDRWPSANLRRTLNCEVMPWRMNFAWDERNAERRHYGRLPENAAE